MERSTTLIFSFEDDEQQDDSYVDPFVTSDTPQSTTVIKSSIDAYLADPYYHYRSKGTSSAISSSAIEAVSAKQYDPHVSTALQYACSTSLFARRDSRSVIVRWMYDSLKKLFLIKRKNMWIEYLESFQDFSSLPKCDIRNLNVASFSNPKNVYFGNWVRDQIRRACESDFKNMTTAKAKRKKNHYIIDPTTQKYWIEIVYPPPRVVKIIPIHPSLPDDSLKDFRGWIYNSYTWEAVIVCKDCQFRIMDPMDLFKFGKKDMLKLKESPMKILHEDHQQYTKLYTKVVSKALKRGLHPESGDFEAVLKL